MKDIIFVFIGAGIGGICRYSIGGIAAKFINSAFPFGTMLINLTGSLLIGLATGLLTKFPSQHSLIQYFIMTGILGGYTTFSSFSLETLRLFQNGEVVYAASYSILSVLLGLGAVFLGMAISKAI